MTTCAYKDGILATDSMVSDVTRGTYEGSTQKVFQLAGGCLYASAGEFDDRAVRALLDQVRSPDQIPSAKDLMECGVNVDAILVFPDGAIFQITLTCEYDEEDENARDVGANVFPVSAPYVAVGNGRQVALGAMWAGKTASQAIEAACEHNVWTRGPVQSMRIKPHQEAKR
jgi:hypothetical protein